MVCQQRRHRASVAPVVDGRMDQDLGESFQRRAKLRPAIWRVMLAICQIMPGSGKGWRMCSSACGVLTGDAGRSRTRLDERPVSSGIRRRCCKGGGLIESCCARPSSAWRRSSARNGSPHVCERWSQAVVWAVVVRRGAATASFWWRLQLWRRRGLLLMRYCRRFVTRLRLRSGRPRSAFTRRGRTRGSGRVRRCGGHGRDLSPFGTG